MKNKICSISKISERKTMKTINIPLPKIGESTTEAKIVEWLKKPGDFIKRDELFAVIGTDKVDSEIFSEYEGTLKEILVKEGEEVSVGTPICTMEVDDNIEVSTVTLSAKRSEAVEVSNKDFSTPLHSAQNDKTQLTPRNSELVSFLSPVVRKMAAENGLSLEDLQKINGTGENGRIRKQDVENFLKPRKQNTSTPFVEEKLQLKVELGEALEPLSKMRKLIAENMEKSWRSIPHVTTFMDVNVTNLVTYREENKEKFLQENAVKLTYTHLIMKAVIDAIKVYPTLNSWFNNEELLEKKNINLGFAAALPDGNLIVPNIKNAQNLSVVEIAQQVSEIGTRAKNGKLKPTFAFNIDDTRISNSIQAIARALYFFEFNKVFLGKITDYNASLISLDENNSIEINQSLENTRKVIERNFNHVEKKGSNQEIFYYQFLEV